MEGRKEGKEKKKLKSNKEKKKCKKTYCHLLTPGKNVQFNFLYFLLWFLGMAVLPRCAMLCLEFRGTAITFTFI